MDKSKIHFWFTLLPSLIIDIGIVCIKNSTKLPDIIEPTNILVFLSPLVLIVSILVPYWLYGRAVKKTKDLSYEAKLEAFIRYSLVKYVSLAVAAFYTSIVYLLFKKPDYIYALGILLIFYVINYPSEYKFKRDFLNKVD